MELGTRILLDIFVIYAAAIVGGAIASQLRQPPVIGELLAGMLIGPHALGLAGVPHAALVTALGGVEGARLALDAAYGVLAELGLIVLLFFVGLELRVSELLAVGRRAALVGLGGVLLPFVAGFALMTQRGWPHSEALFIAAALMSTSTGITARTLRDLGVIESMEARIILSAAVFDDIPSMIVIVLVGALGAREAISLSGILFLVGEIAAFVLFVLLVGARVVRRLLTPLADRLDVDNLFAVAMVLCLGLAVLSSTIGLAPIVGAFLAGLVLGESLDAHRLSEAALPVFRLLVPFFFVIMGMQVSPGLFREPSFIALAVAVTLVAIATKLLGSVPGVIGLRVRSAAIIGTGMVPRGEAGFIVAAMGRSLGILPDTLVSVVAVMSLVTTLIVPPVLGLLYRGARGPRRSGRGAAHEDFAAAGRLPGLGAARE